MLSTLKKTVKRIVITLTIWKMIQRGVSETCYYLSVPKLIPKMTQIHFRRV